MEELKEYYEKDAARFWDPTRGMTGRDVDIYPLLEGLRGRVLDYGCGAGSLIYNLALESRFEKAYGVDLSTAALDRLRAYWDRDHAGDDRLELLQPAGDLLPSIPDGFIDVAISVATIEHVVNPYTVLDELHRVTREDGTLICSVPNYAYIKHILYLLWAEQPRTGTDLPVSHWRKEGWDGMHLHTFTKKSFATLLRDCGWEPQRWLGSGSRLNWTGVGYLRRNYPSFWSGELAVRCSRK